jgi:hypothetical protein
MMCHRLCAALAVMAVALTIPFPAAAAHGRTLLATRPYAVSATSDGLTLKLSTLRSSYPHDALVPVTVTLHNRSNAKAAIEECAGFRPSVQVLDTSGRQIQQPAIPEGLTHPACVDPTAPIPLSIGQTLGWRDLLILRALGFVRQRPSSK